MHNRRLTALVFGIALAAIVTAAGVAYAISSPNVTSSNTDVVRKTVNNLDINTTGGTPTTMLSVRLPAGAWVITINATAVAPGSEGLYIRCGIYSGATLLNQSTRSPDAYVGALSTTAGLHAASSTVVSLKCSQDGGVSGSPNYVDAGAVLWAHKSLSLVH
jgi:hypothetical protein